MIIGKKRAYYCGVLIVFSVFRIESLVFKERLEDFVVRVVEKEYQDGFREHYGDFLDSMRVLPTQKKQKELLLLRKNALAYLEIAHQDWYQVLQDHAELDIENQSRATRLFLTRYGLYQDYKKMRDSDHVHIWAQVKLYTQKLGEKLSFWHKKITDKAAVLRG